MQRPVAARVQYAWHIVLDALADGAVEAARWASGRDNSTALAELARDGGLSRVDSENDSDLRKRVAQRWQSARRLGSTGELARQVSLAFWDSATGTSPRVTIFRQRDSGGGGVVIAVANGVAVDERVLNGSWDWDRDYAAPCRLWIHVETTGLASVPPQVWGDGTHWGQAGVKWGVQFTGTQLLTARGAIARARAGHVWISYLMAGPGLSTTADYGTLLPQLSAGAVAAGQGARTYNHLVTAPTGSPNYGHAVYERRAIGLPGQTLIAIDS